MIDPGSLSRSQRALVRAIGLGPALDFVDSADDPTDAVAFTRAMCDAYRVRAAVRWLEGPTEPVERTVFCCTHPTGAADYLAAYAAISERAPRMLVPMHPALCRVPPLGSVGVATWPPSHERRNEPAATRLVEHLRSGGNVLVFPAGKVGGLVDGAVRDAPWRTGIRKVIARGEASAVPVLVDARNSRLFYAVRARFRRLGLPLLLGEFLRARETRVRIAVGRPIADAAIPADPTEGTALLRERCEALTTDLPRWTP